MFALKTFITPVLVFIFMVLKIFNTMTGRKEVFKPLRKGKVSFYSCGQTVYDELHVGNAKTYCVWDVVYRYLKYKGFEVFHVQNFTDVGHLVSDEDVGEDKIEKKAKEKKINPWELVDVQIKKYYEDMDALNVHRPNVSPRATQVIPEMIDLIKVLLEKGFAYEVSGNVYFDTSKFKDYGRLARLKLKDLKAGARVEVDPNKKHPRDFALWLNARKQGKLHVMNWNSPWGKGYPGWHLECSVMSMKFLGSTIDIHGGGVDHIPVHHTNEIAQSEAATSKKFVNYWMHSAHVTVNGEKMSKSLGNFITAREAINKYGAMPVKLALVGRHYKSQSDFSESAVFDAKNSLERVLSTLKNIESQMVFGKSNDLISLCRKARAGFVKEMDDDFNTPKALSVIYNLVKDVNKRLETATQSSLFEAKRVIVELFGVLGVKLEFTREGSSDVLNYLMEVLINLREQARKDKDYDLSDKIRNDLRKIGIVLEDTSFGVKWKFGL